VRKYSQIKDATILEKKMKQVCNRSLHLDPSDILELGKDYSRLYYKVCLNTVIFGHWLTCINLQKFFFSSYNSHIKVLELFKIKYVG
jgi:hypothetical protein